jgi:N-acetylglutamate synthase-like GNAT family acetyltransferase
MTTHTHLPYWLGAVYVTKEFRNRGIGTALVKRATAKARELGVQILYLHTPDKASLYSRLGWIEIEQCSYSGHEVTIMKKELTQQAVSVGPQSNRFP